MNDNCERQYQDTDRHTHVANPIGEIQGVPFGGIKADEKLGSLRMLGKIEFEASKAAIDFVQDEQGQVVAIVAREDGSIAGRFRITWADIGVGLMASLDDMCKAQGLAPNNES